MNVSALTHMGTKLRRLVDTFSISELSERALSPDRRWVGERLTLRSTSVYSGK